MGAACEAAVSFSLPAELLMDSVQSHAPTDDAVTDKPQNLNEAKLVTVAERSSEIAASILVSVLQDEGIKAVAIGGFTAGFRAEAPGIVRVQTLETDAERAKQIIAELKPSGPN